MIHYKDIPQDELLALREASSVIRAAVYEAQRLTFHKKLKPFANELNAVLDALDDSNIENLLTDEEFECGNRDAESERQHQIFESMDL